MRQLLVILGITIIVWFGIAMSEEGEYPLKAKVEMTGFDTLRYAVVRADTALPLKVTTSGYTAFLYSLSHNTITLTARLTGDGLREAVPVESLYDNLKSQYPGIRRIDAGVDSVRIVLAERQSRSYKPSLDDAAFTFAEQYGLYGEPVVEPAEVVLYGPAEALGRIPAVKVAATPMEPISESGWYTLPLEPVWRQETDVYPSVSHVKVYVPVESYVERTYTVPVTVRGADSSVTLRLYPPDVTVRAWVAQRDLHREPHLTVAIDYGDVLAQEQHITPILTHFPAYIRPRSVEPSEIQCVVIK